jgi:hypothetical protein
MTAASTTNRVPRIVLVPMDVESIETRGENVTVHGYVGDYGVTFHAKAAELEALAALSTSVVTKHIRGAAPCRCEVCGGRDDDPAGIHGRR